MSKPLSEPSLRDVASIGLLSAAYPLATVEAVVDAAGVREERNRKLPAQLMVMFSLGMWLWPEAGYVAVLRALQSGLYWARGVPSLPELPSDGSITNARKRVGHEPLKALLATARGSEAAGDDPRASFAGLRRVAFDEMVLDAPSSPENGAVFGTPPKLRAAMLAECGTLSLLGAEVEGAAEVTSPALLERLLAAGTVDERTLLVADFPGGTGLSPMLWPAARATGAELLWRVPPSAPLPCRTVLPDGTYLSELAWPGSDRGIEVRVVEYRLDGACGDYYPVRLVTSLVDPERADAAGLAACHADRWTAGEVGRVVRLRPSTSGTALRSKSAGTALAEAWALLCVYQAMRKLVRPAPAVGRDHVRISTIG
ncbi:transposase domain-containing protein [Amycolatopsis sp. CA-230715]|uniref:transposase domain-containing protein n=1 Tax=Amycolatopsis sp. CA-230715 TaxID=2745196 RepID=UPI001C014DFB|nr:transposase domain-containing protein [Amycolatopsis sp. CA-230715]QWF78532.1 IS4 family transposase ISMfl1 [Amycolatopsis sp. CA-230715]